MTDASYFVTDAGVTPFDDVVHLELREDPLAPGDLMIILSSGTAIRGRLDETRATRLAAALNAWYPGRVATDDDVAQDLVTQYRDGQVYSFNAPPEV